MPRWAFWALVGLVGSSWGCASEPAGAPLLTLSRVDRDAVEPGSELRILGEGFPVGRTGHARFVGTTSRPGRPPVDVDATVSVRALSAEVLSTQLAMADLRALGGAGTFHGTLRVRFTAQQAAMAVEGVLTGLRLDLQRPLRAGHAATRKDHRRAREVLSFLGATPDAATSAISASGGVRLRDIVDGSLAAQAGLASGDVIVEANGVRVHGLGDLAPPPLSAAMALQVRQAGQGPPTPVEVALSGFETPTLSDGVATLCAAVVLCLLVGVWFGPLPGPTPLLARLQSRLSAGVPLVTGAAWLDGSGGAGDRATAGAAGRGQRWALSCIATALLLSVAVLDPLTRAGWGVLSVFVGLLCWQLVVTMVTVRQAPLHGGQRSSTEQAEQVQQTEQVQQAEQAQQARQAWMAQLRSATVVMWTLGIACIAAGERSLSDLVAGQGALPFRFGVFQQPALLLLLGPFVVHGSRLAPRLIPPVSTIAQARGDAPGGHRASVWDRARRAAAFALSALTRMLLVAVASAVFLGGWSVSGLGLTDPVVATAVGAASFAIKGWLMAGLLHGARLVRLGAAMPAWQTPALCVLAALLAGGFRWFTVAPETQLAVGATACAVTTVLFAVSAWRLMRAETPMAPLVTPFAPVQPPPSS